MPEIASRSLLTTNRNGQGATNRSHLQGGELAKEFLQPGLVNEEILT
jgi:hypothetical protein